ARRRGHSGLFQQRDQGLDRNLFGHHGHGGAKFNNLLGQFFDVAPGDKGVNANFVAPLAYDVQGIAPDATRGTEDRDQFHPPAAIISFSGVATAVCSGARGKARAHAAPRLISGLIWGVEAEKKGRQGGECFRGLLRLVSLWWELPPWLDFIVIY